jgi:subtilisin family serine protease
MWPTVAQSPPFTLDTLTIEGKKAYIVVFKDPPLAQYDGQIRGLAATSLKAAPRNRRDGKLDLQSSSSVAYLNHLETRHEAFSDFLRQRSAEARISDHYHLVLNGMAVLLPEDDVAEVASRPEVAYLAPIRESQLLLAPAARPMDTSNSLMTAQALWAALGGPDTAGRGMKIGILDTGVDFDNPMFIDPTLTPPPGFPKTNDPALKLPAGSKVIVAKVLQSMKDRSNSNLNPGHATAQDLSGHGTHGAAAAAGNLTDLSSTPGARPVVVSGVAPKAFIGSYRIFAPTAEDDNIINAIEEAVRDGMDVINMSFGTAPRPQQDGPDPKVDAANNAMAMGVVVCASAGNFGPTRGTIFSPGVASSIITVGATTNNHDGYSPGQLRQVQVTSPTPPASFTPIIGVRGGGFPEMLTTPIIDADLIDNGILDGSGFGCDINRLPRSIIRNTTVLVQSGRCDMLSKAFNAKFNEAAAMIVYNDQQGGESITTSSLTGLFLPTLFIPRSRGLALKNLIDANAANGEKTNVRLSLATEPLTIERQPNVLAEFSSRGPTRDFLIKPDLVTIGAGSYGPAQNDDARGESRFPAPDPRPPLPPEFSTLYDPSGYIFTNGTSFASPRVAGAAALVKQLHPDWTPADIKAALMTLAARPTGQNEVGATRIMERGAGALDLSVVSRLQTMASPPSHSFGRVVITTSTTLVKEFTVANRSKNPTTYSIRAAFSIGTQSVSVQVSPTELTVPPGGTGTFTLSLKVEPSSGETDNDGLIEISDGERTIPRPLYIPFWIRTASQ